MPKKDKKSDNFTIPFFILLAVKFTSFSILVNSFFIPKFIEMKSDKKKLYSTIKNCI